VPWVAALAVAALGGCTAVNLDGERGASNNAAAAAAPAAASADAQVPTAYPATENTRRGPAGAQDTPPVAAGPASGPANPSPAPIQPQEPASSPTPARDPAMDDPEPAPSFNGAAALDSYPDDSQHPLRALPFRDAVSRAADALFEQARGSLGSEPRLLVIDPLVDGHTGQQTAGTVEMGRQLAGLLHTRYPSLTPAPLTRASLAQSPVLFIGTLTPFNTERSDRRPADAFRIWLTLIDLRSGKIIAKSIDKATASTVDAVPLSYYRDSPTWPRDRTVAAYINSCTFKTKIGDRADPSYLARLPAAAAINEAMQAFGDGQLEQANRLFREAASLAEEDDLRILNGLYLTSWKLGRTDDARAAFDRIVTAGLRAQRLPLKFLFIPARTSLLETGDLGPQYGMWLRELADETSREGACLRVVGHTSKTGTVSYNDKLSYARANAIRDRLAVEAPTLVGHLSSQGRGSRENLIGLGTDDLRDALDRRVELVVTSCAS